MVLLKFRTFNCDILDILCNQKMDKDLDQEYNEELSK